MSVCQPSLVVAAVAATLLLSSAARAQTIAASGQPFPERFIGTRDVGESTRPVNLNPTGINYSDCIQDMVLQYSVTLSGFPGANSDNMQVWATNTGDCTSDLTRGIGVSSEAPTCWLVNDGLTQPNLQSPTTKQFNIPVRALVGPQTNTIPKAGTLVGDTGQDACLTQPSFAATSITVWFLPLESNGTEDTGATAYSAPVITADLVGPPAPTGVSIGDGDTLFVVKWNPNTDADTIGYDLFVDPPPGGGSMTTVDATVGQPVRTLFCPEAGEPVTTTVIDDAASVDAEIEASGLDGAADATMATTTTAADSGSGCFYANVAPSPPATGASACTSTLLTSGTLVNSGVVTTEDSGADSSSTDFVDDEAGILIETESGAIESGTGGISTIPCDNLVGGTSNCAAGSAAYTNTGNPSVTGLNIMQDVIKGLTDGVHYDVVVSAVDGSGNVGPPSTCVTDFPAPVNDFFKIYREDGGQAGGSFCALEAVGQPAGAPIVGVGLGAVAFAMARRRKRNRS